MQSLDSLIPTPRLLEVDAQIVAASVERVWAEVRHGDLGNTPLIRALFALRTLPERSSGGTPDSSIRIDGLVSTPQRPGFQLMCERPFEEFAVAAIGKVWHLDIPFVHVADCAAFAAFAEPDFVKVAWAVQLQRLDVRRTRLAIELRVDATDDAAWSKFQRYFLLIGPASRFIRHAALAHIARRFEPDGGHDSLCGDALLPDAAAEITHAITIHAAPEAIWPWLVQMGCQRAGFYSIDLLDNGGARSAREIHPEWQALEVGQFIPATPDGAGSFEVLQLEAPRALILGGLYDVRANRQLAFAAPRPKQFWQVTWAFVLEPSNAGSTLLSVRARAAFSRDQTLHAAYIRPVHHLMERAQLRHLRARAEGKLSRDDGRDVLDGLAGAGAMALAFATPFLRERHSHWGLDRANAQRALPGDHLVRDPLWGWTHAVEIERSAAEVWPWVAQIGATRGGFYSYQWLENLAGCEVRNAEVIHPEWQARLGDDFFVHPKMPPLNIVDVQRGAHFVAYGGPQPGARERGEPWVSASWLFFVEPLGAQRCRFISRYRAACSEDVATRLGFGPLLLEPIGFVMDRRMLLGVKQRAEALHRA